MTAEELEMCLIGTLDKLSHVKVEMECGRRRMTPTDFEQRADQAMKCIEEAAKYHRALYEMRTPPVQAAVEEPL